MTPSVKNAYAIADTLTSMLEDASIVLAPNGDILSKNAAADRLIAGTQPVRHISQLVGVETLPVLQQMISRALREPDTQFRATLPIANGVMLRWRLIATNNDAQLVLALLTPEPHLPVNATQNFLIQLNRLGRTLSRSLDIPQVASDALRLTTELFEAKNGWLVVFDAYGRLAHWRASDSRPAPETAQLHAALNEKALGSALKEGRPVWVDDPDSQIAHICGKAEMLLAPLRVEQSLIGLLALEDARLEVLQQPVELLDAVAETVALAVRNAQRFSLLARTDTVRERMTNLLVHDIRSPLTSTYASIEIVRRAMQDEELPEFIRESLDAGQYSLRSVISLTDDLLDVKRLQASQLPLQIQPIPIVMVFKGVCNQLQTLARNQQLALRYHVEPEDLRFQGDQKLIRRVLVNLVSNATRFAPPQSEIVLRASLEEEGASVLITVDDSGPGVPAADKERIFQSFTQAEGESGRGSGLGLAFCREVVLAHKGLIWVDDRPEGGSRFSIVVPTVQHTT